MNCVGYARIVFTFFVVKIICAMHTNHPKPRYPKTEKKKKMRTYHVLHAISHFFLIDNYYCGNESPFCFCLMTMCMREYS